MAEQNLILNIVTFSHPKEKQDFSFSAEKKEGFFPIAKYEFPLNINDIIATEITDTAEHLYTDFNAGKDNTSTITVDMLKCTRFAKHYYTYLINQYFKAQADITNSNFIHDNEVWFSNNAETTKNWLAYTIYTVKVQINRVTHQPELVLSYDGVSKILRESLHELEVDTTLYKRVLFEKQIYKHDEMPDAARYDLSKVFPVLNNPLRNELGFSTDGKYVRNKYLNYYNFIEAFYREYINTEEFKKIIPLSGDSFLKVNKVAIRNTTPGSNLLVFGQDKTNKSSYLGMLNEGPFEIPTDKHFKFIYIFHQSDKEFANEMKEWFKGKPGLFNGLKSFLRINYAGDNANSIMFESLENSFDEISKQLSEKPFDDASTYIAIYISPFPKDETDPEKHSVYYQLKRELLKYKITSQVIDKDKINNKDFKYYLPNLAIAILAKLNGVPWRLKRTIAHELIVGVGAFKNVEENEKYVGSAFCFSNDGHFKGFECHPANDTYTLSTLIGKAVRKFRSENENVKRLVIHFYKTMSRKELEPIELQLKELGLDIPVIIITINKTESKDIVIFDTSHKELIPVSGTFLCIGRNEFLLCNNTRYGVKADEKIEGFPFPIRLRIASKDPVVLNDNQTIKDLIDEVYQFSRMYWKSVKQQNLPVTIKYPEMVAEIFACFEDKTIPAFGINNLWFL